MSIVYTPEQSSISKNSPGLSDSVVVGNCLKFLNCTVLNLSMSLGFNSSGSSLSLSLVEDTENGDSFFEAVVGSLWAFSLPAGGESSKIILDESYNLNPVDLNFTNVPFYFAGILSSKTKDIINIGGKTISLTLTDVREILSGVQCLLSGFALSQSLGGGSRYSNVKNVIDVFGAYDSGFSADYITNVGISWAQIKDIVENVRVTVNGLNLEFKFTGTCFTDVPSWYRINEDTLDLLSLVQRVSQDGGSDFICITRKISEFVGVVEIRGIRRSNNDPLTQTEIQDFIDARPNIVETAKKGTEFRNEPSSTIVIGGAKNKMYVSWPTEYDPTMHLTDDEDFGPQEDYAKFPHDIKVRLFGGESDIFDSNSDGDPTTIIKQTYSPAVGSILPFWGYTSDDLLYPLAEPFLSLDHLCFDTSSTQYANLGSRIPLCNVAISGFQVRTVTHERMFLENDENSDIRPFAYLHDYKFSDTAQSGYVRGLPLNTEVMRASLGDNADNFYSIYNMYYPDVASSLLMPKPDWNGLYDYINAEVARGNTTPNISGIVIQNFLSKSPSTIALQKIIASGIGNVYTSNASISKSDSNFVSIKVNQDLDNALIEFNKQIFTHVKNYSQDVMGKKWLVCLPRSEIMNRIWNGLPVPTIPEVPSIEYTVSQEGAYWETVPEEFDGLTASGTFSDTEEQIRRKFMLEDGRFRSALIFDFHPSGNINFNSNGINRAMFYDLGVDSFRPNRIANTNPDYVFVDCTVNALRKRPDLALVEIGGNPMRFDPLDSTVDMQDFESNQLYNLESLATRSDIIKWLWYQLRVDNDFRKLMQLLSTQNSKSFTEYSSSLISQWANLIYNHYKLRGNLTSNLEMVMDPKAIMIPLTSTWVSYGPWYSDYSAVNGFARLDVDQSLVPWNFERSDPWDANLNVAGEEKLARSTTNIDFVDNASITTAGFPEFSIGQAFGYNNNVTTISVDFSIGGVRTTYNMSTYALRPGTFRKGDYDNIARARIDTREPLPTTENIRLFNFGGQLGTNPFQN